MNIISKWVNFDQICVMQVDQKIIYILNRLTRIWLKLNYSQLQPTKSVLGLSCVGKSYHILSPLMLGRFDSFPKEHEIIS